MKLTAMQLAVIVDTLNGSLAISDGGALFNYTKECRKHIQEHLISEMSKVVIHATDSAEQNHGAT